MLLGRMSAGEEGTSPAARRGRHAERRRELEVEARGPDDGAAAETQGPPPRDGFSPDEPTDRGLSPAPSEEVTKAVVVQQLEPTEGTPVPAELGDRTDAAAIEFVENEPTNRGTLDIPDTSSMAALRPPDGAEREPRAEGEADPESDLEADREVEPRTAEAVLALAEDVEAEGEQEPSTAGNGTLLQDAEPDLVTAAGPEGSVDAALEEPELPPREVKPELDPRQVAPDPMPGEVVGPYVLLDKLGKGGAGAVFRARRRSDGQTVALKVLAASKAKRARIVQRFFDEVRAASAVVHPGLIRVFDFIEEEDPRRLAYAMEFIDGESLRERLRREGALDLREAIHIGAEICDGLAALHRAGIIHRDLKPENVMILKHAAGVMPKVKLLDFGVVKFLPVDRTGGAEEGTSDKPGTFVGTPRYMAPEQAAGGVVDQRADLFAMGVLLFEMVTGRCPHEGDSLRDVVLAKLKGAPRITVGAGKEILPQELTDAVDACLQLKPSLRPRSADELVTVLRDAAHILFAVGPVKANDAGVPFRPLKVELTPEDAPLAARSISHGGVHVTVPTSSSSREIIARHPPRRDNAAARAARAEPVTSTPGPASHLAPSPPWRSQPAPQPAPAGAGHGPLVLLAVLVLLAGALIATALKLARSDDGAQHDRPVPIAPFPRSESRPPAASGGSPLNAAKGGTAREAPEHGRDDQRTEVPPAPEPGQALRGSVAQPEAAPVGAREATSPGAASAVVPKVPPGGPAEKGGEPPAPATSSSAAPPSDLSPAAGPADHRATAAEAARPAMAAVGGAKAEPASEIRAARSRGAGRSRPAKKDPDVDIEWR